MSDSAARSAEPLWFRIFWPVGKCTFLALAATALVLDALLIIQAARHR